MNSIKNITFNGTTYTIRYKMQQQARYANCSAELIDENFQVLLRETFSIPENVNDPSQVQTFNDAVKSTFEELLVQIGKDENEILKLKWQHNPQKYSIWEKKLKFKGVEYVLRVGRTPELDYKVNIFEKDSQYSMGIAEYPCTYVYFLGQPVIKFYKRELTKRKFKKENREHLIPSMGYTREVMPWGDASGDESFGKFVTHKEEQYLIVMKITNRSLHEILQVCCYDKRTRITMDEYVKFEEILEWEPAKARDTIKLFETRMIEHIDKWIYLQAKSKFLE